MWSKEQLIKRRQAGGRASEQTAGAEGMESRTIRQRKGPYEGGNVKFRGRCKETHGANLTDNSQEAGRKRGGTCLKRGSTRSWPDLAVGLERQVKQMAPCSAVVLNFGVGSWPGRPPPNNSRPRTSAPQQEAVPAATISEPCVMNMPARLRMAHFGP